MSISKKQQGRASNAPGQDRIDPGAISWSGVFVFAASSSALPC